MDKILIAEDEKVTRVSYCRILQREGFNVIEAKNGLEALDLFKKERPSAVILDLQMPVMAGMDTIGGLKEIDPSVPVIIVTGSGDIATAVEMMRLGAYDFLTKPVEPGRLIVTVKRAVERLTIVREIDRLHTHEQVSLEGMLGKSPAIKKVMEQIEHVAASDFSVIIQGETGTGKTFIAKKLHDMSRRARKPFVKIDLGSIPENLVESELFGYEKGAFTGALLRKKGYFEAADGGSILIDELENLSPLVQSKLLSVAENKAIYHLGSTKPIDLDIRILAATNKEIQKSVREGRFREDLFFRLGEFIITLPPLRERREDIEFFALKFLEDAASELKKPFKGLHDGIANLLLEYNWPGNIRELKNAMRRAMLLSVDGEIRKGSLEFLIEKKGEYGDEFSLIPLKDAVGGVEKRLIKKTLETTKGKKAQTASLLQIDVKTLRSKMIEYGIE